MAFVLPQFGIFAQGTHAHHFLEFDLAPGVDRRRRPWRLPSACARRTCRREASTSSSPSAPSCGAPWLRERHRRISAPFEPVVGADGRPRPRPSTTPGCGSAAPSRTSTWQSARGRRRGGRTGRGRSRRSRTPSPTAAAATSPASSTARRTRRCAAPPTSRSSRRARPAQGGSHVLAMRWVHDLGGVRARSPSRSSSASSAARRPTASSSRRREAADRAHLARRDRGRRPRARDLPSQRALRELAGVRAVLRRVQRRPRRATTGCSRACSASRTTACTTASPTSRASERSVLLRAVAQRARRAGGLRVHSDTGRAIRRRACGRRRHATPREAT